MENATKDYAENLRALGASGPAGDPEQWTGLCVPTQGNTMRDGKPYAVWHVMPSTVAEIRQRGEALLRAHAAEAEPDLAERFDPCWAGYESAEESNQLIVLAAWIGSSMLVGYAVAAIVPSMHYGIVQCQHDLLYVAPEWRDQRIGGALFARMREIAKQRGAQRLLMHAKPGTKLWGMLMLRMRVEETIFVEDL